MEKTIPELLAGLPVNDIVYMSNSTPVEPPYIAYFGDGSSIMQADNYNYYNAYQYMVQFYFDKKDEAIEKQIEDLFDENEIVWEKSPDVFIPDDHITMIYYMI